MATTKLQGKVALVTGGNRGIGVEVCKGMALQGARVLMGSRSRAEGEQAAESFRAQGLDVTVEVVDVSSVESVRELTGRIGDHVEILVNNAGILDREPFEKLSSAEIASVLDTNLRGPILLAQHCSGGMKKRKWGRIVNVTSMMASIRSGLGADSPMYRVSKAGLNAFTICLSQDLKHSRVLVNSVDPGWVRTSMGGQNAHRSPQEGASGILWAVTLPDDGPTGGFFRDGKPLEW